MIQPSTEQNTKPLLPPTIKRQAEFKLTRGETTNSWMAFIREDGTENWLPLRPAVTTFESAQAAIFDEMTAWAFPR